MKPGTLSVLCLAMALVACGSLPTATATTVVNPTVESSPSPVAALPAALPEEAILILAPGNGSRLVGEVHVEGMADSTFEQTLVLQIVRLGDPEEVLVQQPLMIQAELGQRGPFAADVTFTVPSPSDEPGQIRVYATSARDGGITHLTSVQVTLAASGENDLRPAESHPEQIVITSPTPAGVVVGGTVHVEGVALASFEQTLVAEIYDVGGARIGQAPITVAAAEYGVPGPFAVDLPYRAGTAGPGRIVVLDPSPAFGQTLHLASVEVQIEP